MRPTTWGSVALSALLLAGSGAAALAAGTTTRASLSPAGNQGNGNSSEPAIALDGNQIAFSSTATNFATGDGNSRSDIFLRNLSARTTTLVSANRIGRSGNGGSFDPAVSETGRFVVFWSDASDLVTGDTNGRSDVFLRDIGTKTTYRVSVNSNSQQGNGDSRFESISRDGSFVAFASAASNLVPGDTNQAYDLFVRDRRADRTLRVSVDSRGQQANGASLDAILSGDGRYIAYSSEASNLVSGDTNGVQDVFVHSISQGRTLRASVSTSGTQGNRLSYPLAVSSTGRYVVFTSASSNLVAGDTNGVSDIFVRDITTNRTERVSLGSNGQQGNRGSDVAGISPGGRWVAFRSMATNLVTGDTNFSTDIFLRDRANGTTQRVSLSNSGGQGNAACFDVAVADDAKRIAMACDASNLVSGDTNGRSDIFVRTGTPGTTGTARNSAADVVSQVTP